MRYTPDQLEGLRQSPLVKKPDGLPSILQWMEVSADQGSNHNSSNGHTANNGTARRTRGTRDGEGATTEQKNAAMAFVTLEPESEVSFVSFGIIPVGTGWEYPVFREIS
jgi:hypothetical protein